MGFLAVQKSQQVVLGGLAAASSAIVVDGPIYGYSSEANSTIANMTSLIFWLKTASGASSVDLNVNKTTIGFENPRGVWPNIYNPGGCEVDYTVGGIIYAVLSSRGTCPTGAGPELPRPNNAATITWEVGSPYQLQPGQKVRVTIDLDQLWMGPTNPTGIGACINQAEGCLYAGEIMKNEEFRVTIKPPVGSVLEIDRIAPASVDTVNDLG